MDARVVVAGKAATRFHGGNNVAEGIRCFRPSPHSTIVAVLPPYLGDLRAVVTEATFRTLESPVGLIVAVVVIVFGLLYLAVVTEERHMDDATKPRRKKSSVRN